LTGNIDSRGSKIVSGLFNIVSLIKTSDVKDLEKFSLDGIDGYEITFTKLRNGDK
jgi:hypothetical protein